MNKRESFIKISNYQEGISFYKRKIENIKSTIFESKNDYDLLVKMEEIEFLELSIKQNQRRHEYLIEGKQEVIDEIKCRLIS